MMPRSAGVKGLLLGGVGLALVVCLLASCVGRTGSQESDSPVEQPEFLTPIAQAQEAGLNLYWFGPTFQGGELTFSISGYADLFAREDDVSGLQLEYGAKTGQGSVTLDLESYLPGGGDKAPRQRARSIPGSRIEQLRVGDRDADLHYLPAGTRPVNALWLFVNVNDGTVVVQASAGRTGIPGTDPNPLIDKDLLIQVVADNLRPYPE
jgi:hypothetical protein